MKVELNREGEAHARELIQAGKIDRGPWSFDAADGNHLLGPEGSHWAEYARYHLGVDTEADDDTKARWKYPYGKDGKLYTRALSAIRSRASQEGATEVYDAAGKLLEELKSKGSDKGDEEAKSRPSDAESRCWMLGLELRASDGADGKPKSPGTIVGYTAVFDRFSQDLGGFREKIAPGAFRGVVSQDVRALVNHDPNLLIGRSKPGTLRMSEDDLGLRVEIDLPDTQLGRDTAELVRRGDLDGMSFSFVADRDEWDYRTNPPERTLVSIRDLYDVGPVAYPAYTDTSAAMRSLEASKTPPPAPSPAATSPAFDPSEVIQFRLIIEQAAVLPAVE